MTGPRSDGGPDSGESVALELRLFATFREAVGQKTLTRSYHEPVTVRSVVADLEESFPDLDGVLLNDEGDLRSTVTVIRNGRHVAHFDGVDTALADGDTLGVMPPVSGGGGAGCRSNPNG